MKKFLLYASLCLITQVTFAQSTMPAFRGWDDDSHYILKKENDLVKVNVVTGKETPHTIEETKRVTEVLPDGYNTQRNWRYATYTDDENGVVFSQDNDLYYFKKGDQEVKQLTANDAEEKNPTFSPDGKKVAFTREKNLYVIDLATGLERQLTTDGGDLIYNGWASWVYYEEILGRSTRYRAFYWSPDSKRIAFLRFDDNGVPNFPIYHHEAKDMTHGYLEMTSYPKAGDPNPKVKLGIAHVEHQQITWVEKNNDLEYLAMVHWTPSGDEVLYQQMNRDQNILKIYKTNLGTGKSKEIYEERQKTWVEWYNNIDFLKDNKGFILRSNKDGWYNLYHYNMEGKLVNQITNHDFRVSNIVKIDEDNERIFYYATGKNPVERHFFVATMDGKKQMQLTEKAGTNRANLSPQGTYFVNRYSAYNNPGELSLMNTKGKVLKELGKNTKDGNKAVGMTVEFFTIPTEDGFDLPAYWVLPPDFDKTKKYPVIFSIYGGPDAGSVYNSYRSYSWNQMVKEGVIRFVVDHRGSGKFGKKGMDYLHRSLGKWEMNDYITAVKWLREQPFIDETKVGIQGSSYGGYMSAMALTYGADYFTHGIAGLSVTDWRLYDNVYTERYMDEPKDNQEGYDFGSVMTHAENLKGKLLIVHGTIDDNVHLQNSMQLISKLQDEGKDFEMMLYPGGRHGWGGAKGTHNRQLSMKFWRKHFFEE